MSVERAASTVWNAMRRLSRAPAFFALTAGTLALGLGASAALYSLVDGVLMRQLPFRDAASIVRVQEIGERGPSRNMSQANFEDLARDAGEASSRFAAMARYAVGVTTVAAGTREPARVPLGYVSRQFFSVFGVEPRSGRVFSADEARPGGEPVVVVSESVWRDVLGSPNDAARATLSFDGVTHVVVGVMPDHFDQPEGARVWAPAERLEPVASRTALNWRAVGRLRAAGDLEAARSRLSSVARRLKQELGDATWMRDVAVTSLRDSIVGRASAALWFLFGAAVFLLVVACANVANLFLARATARRREIAVRRALGAGGWDLFPQFLGETLGVALAGGLGGGLLAAVLLRTLRAWAPAVVPRLDEATAGGLGWATFAGLLAAVAAVAVVLAALLTAWSSDREAARSPALAGGRADSGSRAKRRTEQALAAGQMALAMTLLGVAALLGRSVQELLSVDPGYEIGGRVLVEMEPPPIVTPADAAARLRLLETLRESLSARSGVRAVGMASSAPLTTAPANGTFLLAVPGERLENFEDFGRVARLPGRTGEASYVAADAGYFAALEIPVLRGRGFETRDTIDAPHVALVSQGLAERTWPGQDPLGRQIEYGNMDGDLRLLTVVGVVGDVRHASLADEATPIVYTHLRQRPAGARSLRIVVAPLSSASGVGGARGEAREALLVATRSAVREAAPDLPPIVRPYGAIQAAALLDRSFQLRLVGGFALGALLLATAAAAGVAALDVARRRRELGVRLAIGAAPRSLLALVLREQARWLVASLAVGVVATWVTGRLLRAQLWGVAPGDPWALAGAALALGVVVMAATAIPARRAAATDPVEALRSE